MDMMILINEKKIKCIFHFCDILCNFIACYYGKDVYPKGYKCRRTHSCTILARRDKCNEPWIKAVGKAKWCLKKMKSWVKRHKVKDSCIRSCSPCRRE